MKTLQYSVVIILALMVSVSTEADVDHVDTASDIDEEAAMKCDACKIIATKFAEKFENTQGDIRFPSTPKDEDIIEAAESTCDDAWEGYGVAVLDGVERLVGSGSEVKAAIQDHDEDNLWSRRLQDMCDELLAEVQDEKTLYNIWASDNGLAEYLCSGEGAFGACSEEDWGPWPGDDDEYDDIGDFDYPHDEF